MRGKILEFINGAIPALIVGSCFFLPLFFLPITSEFFEFPKQVLLSAVSCLLFAAWAVKMFLEKQVRVIRTPFDVPVALLVIGYSLLVIFSKNRLISATSLSTWAFPALGILYFVAVSNLKTKKQLLNCYLAILLAGGILAVWAILQYFQRGSVAPISPVSSITPAVPAASVETISPFPDWMQDRAFNPVGGIVTLSVYLLVIISFVVARLRAMRESQASLLVQRIIEVASLLAILIALLLINPLTSALASKITGIDYPRPILLDLHTSWSVAIEAIRREPLFGVGPGLYASAFSQFKPLGFNNSPYWNVRFGIAHNQWLQILTTGGLLGLVVFGFLMVVTAGQLVSWVVGQQRMKTAKLPRCQAAILILLLSSFLTTWTTPIAFLFFLFLALWQKEEFLEKPGPERSDTIHGVTGVGLLPKIIFGPVLALTLVACYFLGRAYAAEVFYKQSLDTSARNEGISAYTLLQRGIQTNPFAVSYHLSYSQVNLALANSLAARGDLTDQDQVSTTRLIQQAIREGKIATQLYPQDFTTWGNLAVIYRNLSGIAQNAEAWAVTNFQEAIRRNPADPNLRMDLGGVFYIQGDFERARSAFLEAANLKPDLANAHYNLAAALRELGRTEEAVDELQIALNLVPFGSPDYEKVREELGALQIKPKESQYR